MTRTFGNAHPCGLEDGKLDRAAQVINVGYRVRLISLTKCKHPLRDKTSSTL